jgi:hypothetical protein
MKKMACCNAMEEELMADGVWPMAETKRAVWFLAARAISYTL